MSTFVIAEAAACHDGSLTAAFRLIDLAADIGASACKFQWCSNPARMAQRRHVEDASAYNLLAFPVEWHGELARHCAERGVEYMCTVFLPEDLHVIAPHVKRFKISAFESQSDMLRHALCFDLPVIVSLGMGQDAQYFCGDDIRYLHCVSAYPAPVEQMNLARVRSKPARPIHGLSDHSRHPWTGALAVAAGASIVEFHLRLDTTWPNNPDFAVSRTPEEAADYVANIRLAELMLGTGDEGAQPCEEGNMKFRVTR